MSSHSVPLHCPYCAGESLHPHGDAPGAWECRECLRAFGVRFLGLLSPNAVPSTAASHHDAAAAATVPTTSGGAR
jgi:hypothetical protein